MKKCILLLTLILILACSMPVFASGFDDNEYNNATIVSGSGWNEIVFDKDILLKVDMSQKDVTTVFEVMSDGNAGNIEYKVFTKSQYAISTQNNATYLPAYIGVPHLRNTDSSYVKIGYDYANNYHLKNKKIKVRARSVTNNLSGWRNADRISLNEEHQVKFNSLNDDRWYKIEVPDEEFKYTFTIETSTNGCFISELYSQADLEAGGNKSTFSDCFGLKPAQYTVTAQLGEGTYYMHVYPTDFDSGVLNSKIIFATTNKTDLVVTSFGAYVSEWAKPEIEKAYANGLIPDSMITDNLTMKVNRGGFAAIAVKLYSKMSDKYIEQTKKVPFIDIANDDFRQEIEMAYQIDVAKGTSDKTYEPLVFINREELATMLCRVAKKTYIPNWSLENDSKYKFDTSDVRPFADDSSISDWAKPSVYLMAKYEIVKGIEGNKFAPKNETSYQDAVGYASATKEAAIIMSQRMLNAQMEF